MADRPLGRPQPHHLGPDRALHPLTPADELGHGVLRALHPGDVFGEIRQAAPGVLGVDQERQDRVVVRRGADLGHAHLGQGLVERHHRPDEAITGPEHHGLVVFSEVRAFFAQVFERLFVSRAAPAHPGQGGPDLKIAELVHPERLAPVPALLEPPRPGPRAEHRRVTRDERAQDLRALMLVEIRRGASGEIEVAVAAPRRVPVELVDERGHEVHRHRHAAL